MDLRSLHHSTVGFVSIGYFIEALDSIKLYYRAYLSYFMNITKHLALFYPR